MKNMKKTLIMCISLCLIVLVAIGGTVAYLTVDPVEKSNVFTVGEIAIKLDEVVDTVGAATVTPGENGATYVNVMPGDYLKKEVSIENTGTRPAYVAVEVTLNNANLINTAIDEFYEAKGYSESQLQEIYDYIFDGFGLNYTKVDADGNATGMRLTITGDDMPEKALQVDSVKTISEYWLQYSGNWFKDEDTVIPYDGYYTTGMNDYELRYTYYFLLEAGEKSTLFNGFNVPSAFNAEQLKMFEGLNIDINASAIQADNFATAQEAFSTLKNEIVWEVKDAASLAEKLSKGGKIRLVNDIANDGEVLEIPSGVNVELDLNGKTFTAGSDGYAFANVHGGTLIINDTAKDGAVNGVIYTEAGGKTVINDGTFNAVDGGKYVLLNSAGSLTINGGEINGGSSYPIYSYDDGHELVINDVTVNGTFGCINAYAAGNVTVNDGTFKMTGVSGNTSHLVYVSGTTNMTINGGTFEKLDGISMSGTGGGGICTASNAKIIINDGDFSGDYRDLYVWSAGSEIIVKGGTYKFNPTAEGAKIADGYKLVQNSDGTYTVEMPKASTASDLKNEIANGSSLVAVDGKLVSEDLNWMTFTKDTTIQGGSISRDTASGNPLTVKGTNKVTFEDVKFESVKGSAVLATRQDGANIVLNNCVFDNLAAPSTGNTGIQVYAKDVTMVFNGCTFNNMPIVTNSSYKGNVKLVFNNCTFTWTGANCPGMINIENDIIADIDFNNCKYVYDALDSKYSKNFVATSTSVGEGTTVDFNNFEMIGKGNVCSAWTIVGKGGVKTGNNVTVTATGIKTYTFNGEAVDFDTYLFK